MSTRRFFTFGACLAAAALLVPATALAQATVRPSSMPGGVSVGAYKDAFDRLQVRWAAPPRTGNGASGDPPWVSTMYPLTGYRIYYKDESPSTTSTSGSSATTTTGGAATTTVRGRGAQRDLARSEAGLLQAKFVDCMGANLLSCVITGLKPNRLYGVRVAPINAVGVGRADGTSPDPQGRTTAAPAPDRVTGVEVMPDDRVLRIKWKAPYAGHSTLSIASYDLSWRTSVTVGKSAGTWSSQRGLKGTEGIIGGLTNGTKYDIEVRATNSAGLAGAWSITVQATPMMATPALPVFGALALGAGLVAAGRRRLRRRQRQTSLRA